MEELLAGHNFKADAGVCACVGVVVKELLVKHTPLTDVNGTRRAGCILPLES